MSENIDILPPYVHFLCTMAAVPTKAVVLDVGSEHGRHSIPLLHLGFMTYGADTEQERIFDLQKQIEGEGFKIKLGQFQAVTHYSNLGLKDAQFDWVLAFRAFDTIQQEDEIVAVLEEIWRVMKFGAWCYLSIPADRFSDATGLTNLMHTARFALAEKPHLHQEQGQDFWVGIYRKTNHDSIL